VPEPVQAHDDPRPAVKGGLPDASGESGRTATRRDLALHPVVGRAFDALDGSNVRWCLLRGESDLASPEGDIDLLVGRGDMRRLRVALRRLGFAPLRAWGRAPHRFFVAYDEESARRIKLDVVTQLAYGPYQELWTSAAAGCLARRRHVGPLALLSPDDAFWTLLLHCMLDREAFSAAHRKRLLELVGRADYKSELADVAGAAFAERLGSATALELVRAQEWPALTAIAREARHALARRRPRFVRRLRIMARHALRRAANVLPVGRR
jgi:hypothetical protein